MNRLNEGYMTYQEQLRDVRWIDRRAQVKKAADYTCQDCKTKGIPLEVHHKAYVWGRMAWEYSDEELLCVCDHCHEIRHIPDCCHTPLFQLVYDIDARCKVLVQITPAFCPVCGTSLK